MSSNQNPHSFPLKTNTTIQPPVLILGGGYSSDKQIATYLSCLNSGSITYSSDAKSIIFFSDSRSFGELQKDLNIDVSESASIGLFSEEVSASYVRHVKDTAYTQSFYYSETVTLPTAIYSPTGGYGEALLNDIGRGVYKAGPDQFREVCGDKLVQQSHLGAGLYVTLRVQFNSLYDKSSFNAEIGANYGNMFSISGKISQIVSKNQIKGNIEVSALQVGGDVSQIAKIFTVGPNPYAITSCSLENMDACQKTINGVLAYAANEFPNQIDFKGGKVLGSAANMGYTFMPFSILGLNVGDSVLTPEIESARKHLGNLYIETQNTLSFVNHITNSPMFYAFPNDVKPRVIAAQDTLQYNVKLLENADHGAIACYELPKRCLAIADKIDSNIKAIDDYVIYQVRNGYNFAVTIKSVIEIKNDNKIVDKKIAVVQQASAVALPDNLGTYYWSYEAHLNTLKIIKNNDGTISLNINGGQYPTLHGNGQYEIHDARCSSHNDPIPHPLNMKCRDMETTKWAGMQIHSYSLADMTLQSMDIAARGIGIPSIKIDVNATDSSSTANANIPELSSTGEFIEPENYHFNAGNSNDAYVVLPILGTMLCQGLYQEFIG